MTTFNHHIIQEVAALKIPQPEEVVITHGSALVVRGIRPEQPGGDIDIVTSLENNLFLEKELGFLATRLTVGINQAGRPVEVITRRDTLKRFDSHRWDFSMQRYNQCGKGRMYLPELGKLSEQDDETGIWVATPELVRLTKLQTGRQKDADDVALIDSYLKR